MRVEHSLEGMMENDSMVFVLKDKGLCFVLNLLPFVHLQVFSMTKRRRLSIQLWSKWNHGRAMPRNEKHARNIRRMKKKLMTGERFAQYFMLSIFLHFIG